jgi:hypothetical protein
VALLGFVAGGPPLGGSGRFLSYLRVLLRRLTTFGCPGDRGINSLGSYFCHDPQLTLVPTLSDVWTLRRAFFKLQVLGEPLHEAAVGAHASRVCGIGIDTCRGGGH